MIKRDELTNPNSCLNRAWDDESLFVLLARDIAAPDTIRDWVVRRIRCGKNTAKDPQMVEAIERAMAMERELYPWGVNSPEWHKMNDRRIALIQKKNRDGLTADEACEYERCRLAFAAVLRRDLPKDVIDPEGKLDELERRLEGQS